MPLRHMSSVWKPQTSRYHIGQCRYRTFLSLQKVPLISSKRNEFQMTVMPIECSLQEVMGVEAKWKVQTVVSSILSKLSPHNAIFLLWHLLCNSWVPRTQKPRLRAEVPLIHCVSQPAQTKLTIFPWVKNEILGSEKRDRVREYSVFMKK